MQTVDLLPELEYQMPKKRLEQMMKLVDPDLNAQSNQKQEH
jgi:hypothetical protein